jgi:hypothetical protein
MNTQESPNTILGPMAQRACAAIFSIGFAPAAFTQTALTWQQVKEKFELAKLTLKAAQANIGESRAAQITAYLVNPEFTLTTARNPHMPQILRKTETAGPFGLHRSGCT